MPQEQSIRTSSLMWELSHSSHQRAIPTKALTYGLNEGPSVCYPWYLSPSACVYINIYLFFLPCMAWDIEAPLCPVNLQEVLSRWSQWDFGQELKVLTERGDIQCLKTFILEWKNANISGSGKNTHWFWRSIGDLRAMYVGFFIPPLQNYLTSFLYSPMEDDND